MIDVTAYPKPVPLSRADALVFLTEPAPDVSAMFLAFVMLPVEERIGEWRFAGAARSLNGAFVRIAEFAEVLGMAQPGAGYEMIAQ
ncbi:unnamed protein product [Gemmata massiliana]|uniref:Uncharacterized protein n=1 Tax=Gemmata massiliana TaxID=1210884 RepID=A0A6P2DEG4_9BACT|nr:hypothetical protein [Gemmata massiliana]VTR99935.1 unnamed protein product [Gemmata massiliana]